MFDEVQRETLRAEINRILDEAVGALMDAGHLESGSVIVLGCSTSEITGARIGKGSVQELGEIVAEAMLAADAAGYEIVMHCHDELIVEAPLGHGSLTALCNLMGIAPAWAKGLPLRADGYECDYYRKD